MKSEGRKQKQRLKFLELVYNKTKSAERKLVNIWDLGKELNWDLQTTASVAQSLVGDGLVRFSATGDTLEITEQGTEQILAASARIAWLHISDLHIKDESFDRKVVLEALLDDVRRRASVVDASLEKIDLVFFTGDLAFSGKREEYEIAYNQFIEPLAHELGFVNLSRRFFLVPGNHDVDREQIRFTTKAIRGALQNRQDVQDLMLDDHEFRLLSRIQAPYFEFFQDTFDEVELLSPGNYYVQKVYVPDRGNIAIVGLNSAWLSQDSQDKGSLILGEPQVKAALDRCQDADMVICLLHHPFEWFNEENQDTELCRRRIVEKCDVILSGHVHRPNLISSSSLEGKAIFIPSGAIFTDRGKGLTYNYASLNLDSGDGTVFFRHYSERRDEWVKGVELTGDEADGKRSFSISPLSLTGRPSVVTVNSHPPLDEDEGFLDWSSKVAETGEELTKLMQEVGLKTNAAGSKITILTERLDWTQGDVRRANVVVSQMATVIGEFADDITEISSEMKSKWHVLYASLQPYLTLDSNDLKRFIKDSGDADSYAEQAMELAFVLETVSGQINSLKKGVSEARSQVNRLRGASRVLNRSVRRSDLAFGHFLETLEEMSEDMNRLSKLSRDLPSALVNMGLDLQVSTSDSSSGNQDESSPQKIN